MTRRSVGKLSALAVGLAIAAILVPRSYAPILAANLTLPPGALNPAVTQSNIQSTICKSGWTATIRPPVSYTNGLKQTQMAERHLSGRPSDYEEDHFIPLELGGHPTKVDNLWPQPIQQARIKDKWETAYNRAVCGGKLTLVQAQQKIKDPSGWK